MNLQYPIERPALVERALANAVELGFDVRPDGNLAGSSPTGPSCCIDEVGALLRTLAAAAGETGRVAEIGTGAGVGAAWLASGLATGATLVSVEIDARLASASARLFDERSAVTILTGKWEAQLPPLAPFDLVFADGGSLGAADLAGLLRPGGMAVLDDLTPEVHWPEAWRGQPDPKRELALRSGLFVATELRLREQVSALVLVRAAAPPG